MNLLPHNENLVLGKKKQRKKEAIYTQAAK